MDLINILKYVVAISAVAIIISILLQQRGGGGLGVALGGSGGESYRSKRGIEAVLQNATIIASVIFAVASLAIAILSV